MAATPAFEPLRVGIVGCGWVAQQAHLPAMQRLPEVSAVAATDLDAGQLRLVTRQFGIMQAEPSLDALLANPMVEAVAVCVPAPSHVAVATQALAAGKHVFVEKPLALSLTACDELIEAARAADRVAMVGHNLRFLRLFRQARAMIGRGDLGAVRAVRTAMTSGPRPGDERRGWPMQRALGGGALIEQAIHQFDLWRFLLRREVEEVYARSHSGAGDDQSAVVMAQLQGGVLASTLCSEAATLSNDVDVYGDQGRLRVTAHRFDGLERFGQQGAAGDLSVRLVGMIRALRALPHGIRGLRRGGEFMQSYRAEWRHFASAVRAGSAVESTLEDGRSAVAIMLAALASAKRGGPVRVEDAAELSPRDLGIELR